MITVPTIEQGGDQTNRDDDAAIPWGIQLNAAGRELRCRQGDNECQSGLTKICHVGTVTVCRSPLSIQRAAAFHPACSDVAALAAAVGQSMIRRSHARRPATRHDREALMSIRPVKKLITAKPTVEGATSEKLS